MSDSAAVLFYGVSCPNKINLVQLEKGVNDKKYKEYWNKLQKIINKIGCEIIEIGINFKTNHAIGITNSMLIAVDGDIEEIINLDVEEEWNTQLKEFCDELNIEYQTPKWYLVNAPY